MTTTTETEHTEFATTYIDAGVSGAIQLACTDAGAGEPALVFLPGWCSGREVFDPLIPRTAPHRRSVSIDWRGHGESAPARTDFGLDGLVEDAIAVIDGCGIDRFVPVALAHAGWAAIELRRRLGDRVAGLALVDWIVLDPPPPFLAALDGLQDPEEWAAVRGQLLTMWRDGHDIPALDSLLDAMAAHGFDMWSRAGREIAASFRREGRPLEAVARLTPPPPTIHVYAQPTDPAFLDAQRTFAVDHPWFEVEHLTGASTHFPMFETPGPLAERLLHFAAGVG